MGVSVCPSPNGEGIVWASCSTTEILSADSVYVNIGFGGELIRYILAQTKKGLRFTTIPFLIRQAHFAISREQMRIESAFSPCGFSEVSL